MEYILENEFLEVRIEDFGAELVGLRDKKDGREYIWQKDKRFWGKSSPILFPFVGSLKDGRYTYQDVEYKLGTRHGFARDYEFEIFGVSKDSIEFLFESSIDTKKVYPFDFKLYLKYTLSGKKLILEYRVENCGDEKMLFSVGGHPAFATPLDENITYSDYYLEFEKPESGDVRILEGALVKDDVLVKAFEDKKIVLTKDRFKDDAIIIQNPNSSVVSIKNDKSGYNLRFSYKDFKYIAFWNVVGAEFVCIEPWCGITDRTDTNGKLEEKEGIESLEPHRDFVRKIEIEIL